MAVGNRYQLIDFQTYVGNDILNVYYYRQVAGTHTAAVELVDLFVSSVLPFITAVQHEAVTHISIGAKNLDVPTDFNLTPLVTGNVGQVTGQGLPPFVAWAFRLVRTQTDIHNGAKRIVGVAEGWQANGVADSTVVSALNDLAEAMALTLDNFEPRIMRKLLDSEGHLIGYEDFPMGAGQYVRISSQNTRKFGRGI